VGGNAGTVTHSRASVVVTAENAVGGLVGDMNGAVFYSWSDSQVSGQTGVGGLVGLNTYGRIVNSYGAGSARGKDNVGGLVGVNTDALIQNSFADTKVESSSRNAGGIVGFNSLSRVFNSYANGMVSGVDAVGGLAGNNNGTIHNAYATVAVSGETNVGGLVGVNTEGMVIQSFWDVGRSGQAAGAGNGAAVTLDAALDAAGLATLNAERAGWAPGLGVVSDDVQLYCDTDGDNVLGESEQVPENLVWDFGSNADEPALTCTIGGLERQRDGQ